MPGRDAAVGKLGRPQDETDLMAIRVDLWKMHIGVKPHGIWWNQKYYPSVPT